MNTPQLFTFRKLVVNPDGFQYAGDLFEVYVDSHRKVISIKTTDELELPAWQRDWDNVDDMDVLLGEQLDDVAQTAKYPRWTLWKDKTGRYRLAPIPAGIGKSEFHGKIKKVLKKPISKISTIYKMFML